jgi:hypothetical protein
MINTTIVGVVLTSLSFIFNIIFYVEWKRIEKKYKDELLIESNDSCILENNIQKILQIANDNIPEVEKIDEIIKVSNYCIGYLGGMQHHFPKKIKV